MADERWQKIQTLYHRARALSSSERATFLEEACASDADLRSEVEAMLSADGKAGSLLEASPLGMNAQVLMPLSAGTRLGPYEIQESIGAGGMGEVYRGRDTRLHRTVAIKVLSGSVIQAPERRRRFLQEARAASALNHPNIVTLHDIGSENGIDFLVMEYVPEKRLDRLISSNPLPVSEVLENGIQIASALAAAHAAGIIHRDIKPANVMVTPQGHVKVLDFGLAKWPEDGPIGPDSPTRTTDLSLTQAGQVIGTVAYMSPEQARGERLDVRTDLFSFGAVLYEMAAGRMAFPKMWDWAPPPGNGVDPALYRIILKLLQADREERYASATDVAGELNRVQQRLQSRKARRKRRVVAAFSSAAAGVLLVGFLWLRPNAPFQQNQWVPVTSLPDSVSQPALSPDGRMLTFVRGPGTFFTPGQIYVKMLPDGEPKQLTHDGLRKLGPVFSADGSRIAYGTLDEVTGNEWNTWTVPVLGGEAGLWLRNASGLTWIDKRQLMFSEIEKASHMAIVTADESRAGVRDVYVPARENGMAHRSFVSPDGKSALVVEMDGPWLPCRLVSMDGKSLGRQVGPAGAPCTFAAWSPDAKWMYLNSSAGGRFHIWRQRFPDGQPEQITSGPTEEEGIAMAADGRSFITAVGLRLRSVLLRDSAGERQVSLEGYAMSPRIAPDGKRLCYVVLRGPSEATSPVELWAMDLGSGRSEQLLPGRSLKSYLSFDISPDGREVAASLRGSNSEGRLWVVPLDRQSPPHEITNVESDRFVFWLPGEILFYRREGNSGFAYRIREDGTELRKAIEEPIREIRGVSPDGQWLVAFATGGVIAYPLGQGTPVPIFSQDVRLAWSSDRKFLFISYATTTTGGISSAAGKTYVIPLLPGHMLPEIPAAGFRTSDDIARLPGTRVIDSADATPGATSETYAFSRETMQRNLYRVPVP
jgi:serine/threonine protein kinase